MKLALFAVMAFLFSCAGTSPYRAVPGGAANSAGATRGFDNDVIDCERQAAVASVGSKGEAFSNCMKARGHTPGR
ncbi:MAG: hypothetical protein ACM3SP_13585 [Chloroflexota bacterium]